MLCGIETYGEDKTALLLPLVLVCHCEVLCRFKIHSHGHSSPLKNSDAEEPANRTTEWCQALAPALKEKPLQSLILSSNDCRAEGAKAAGLKTDFWSRFLNACFRVRSRSSFILSLQVMEIKT